ncbi:prolyl 4-hydroxylase subunit alpha-2-like [Lucilia sericata]|uniref:prolyl 4-hydroxylase subunit alpha-2-like n=1 Tax=Lucilia sericata TaxID=13632 RepID=UPI0018A7EA07|nr:prolyl 4-hydroxylase subunit alpha-2-like [Lucilia sericata]
MGWGSIRYRIKHHHVVGPKLSEENQKSVNRREEYLYNPLNGFTLIRRMYSDWTKIELFIRKTVGEDHLAVIRHYRPEMPTFTDILEASEAINRLQTVYDLKANDLVKGIINGQQYETKLKSIDSYFMGYYLFSKKLYYPAGFWLNSSLGNYEDENEFNKIVNFNKEKILELYAETLVQQNRPVDALRFVTQASDLQPLDAHLLNRKNQIQLLIHKSNDKPLEYPTPVISNYERGCRGDFSKHLSKLYCLYNTNTTSFLRLAPIKMELLNFEPYMVLFHDIISDKEIKHLINLARPNLQRAAVYDNEASELLVANERTSKVVWLDDDIDVIIKRLKQRISDMTGLNIADAEELQVVNYGLGGHYEEHYDFFNATDSPTKVLELGDRIATVLFYLSDVEQGGATVFPKLETAVFPRKGSALMWYNLNNKVEIDEQTLHAACPVLVGSKWVCSKWIRSNAQIFKKPCYI